MDPARACEDEIKRNKTLDSSKKRWANLTQEELLSRFDVNLETGLESAVAENRLAEYGPNELEDRGGISPWKILIAQFQDLMVVILLVATLVAFISWYLEGAHGLPADAIIILAIVVANAWLGFTQEYQAERIIKELQASTKATATVLRDGSLREVEQADLVPGDIVEVGEGDLVPADLVLLSSSALRANESLLTGESVPVDKNAGVIEGTPPVSDRHNELFSGTVITGGTGRALVVTTGGKTELGKIADTLQSTQAVQTPLELRLDQLGRKIGWGVLLLSVFIGGVVLLVEGKADTETLLRVAMFSVALAVAAVPEGLPAVLTVGLSIGAKRLAANNVVCRQMAAVETLGSVTTIVTDKTGTLTQNQMTIRELYAGGEEITVSGDGYSTDGEVAGMDDSLRALIECGVLASGGDLERDESGQVKAIGDPMDAAFLVLAEKAGIDWRGLRKEWKQVDGIPFSSERARVCSVREKDGQKAIFVKGAPQAVLERCSHGPKGEGLDDGVLASVNRVEEDFGREALRGLALGRRDFVSDREQWESGLTFLGLAGFEDPPRSDVPDAIESCHQAGVRVVMCTGDHPTTALAIGRRIGICEQDCQEALVGADLSKMSDEEFAEAAATHDVCARFAPEQKLRLVEALIAQGEVVAMTGDGVNDAPSLKKVHVGVAMGQSGTAVAVEASDLVLTDDRFSSIVKAVREGRAVFLNIQHFIAFLFSGNFGVVLAMFIGTLLAGFFDLRYADGSVILPLAAAQILWMNLVTDGAPALAFAMGRSSDSVMMEKPRDPRSPILSNRIWALVAFTGTCLAAIFLVSLDLFYHGGIFTVQNWGNVYTQSLAFYILVTARLLNAFNFQDLEHSLFDRKVPSNPYLRSAALLSWVLTLGLVKIPFAANFFGLKVLEWEHLVVATVVLPPLVFIPAEIFKRWNRNRA